MATKKKSGKRNALRTVQMNKLTVEMKNVTSELIRDFSYSNGDLFITMRNGARYRYPKVDSLVVQDFLAAESFGRFFNDNIRYLAYERLE